MPVNFDALPPAVQQKLRESGEVGDAEVPQPPKARTPGSGPPADFPPPLPPKPSIPLSEGQMPLPGFGPGLPTPGKAEQQTLPGMSPDAIAAQQPRPPQPPKPQPMPAAPNLDSGVDHLHPTQFAQAHAINQTARMLQRLHGPGGFQHLADFALGEHLAPYHAALEQHIRRNLPDE